MSTPVLTRTAPTDAPILDVLADRWSTRAYDAETPIDEDALTSALEAARWAPSANNSQPWRFVVARRGSALHAEVLASLIGFNQMWAANAAALIVAVVENATAEGTAISHAQYDLGQAVAHLSVQAHHDGLLVHQMSGFDPEAVRAALDLEERFAAFTVLALGTLGDASVLPEPLQEREQAPRERRALAESIIAND